MNKMPGAQVGTLMGEVCFAVKEVVEHAGKTDAVRTVDGTVHLDPQWDVAAKEVLAKIQVGIESGAPYDDLLVAVVDGCRLADATLERIVEGKVDGIPYSERAHRGAALFFVAWMDGIKGKALAFQAGMKPAAGCTGLLLAALLPTAMITYVACGL